ncbi:MAG: hypothetical protein ACK5O2_01790 [Microthrixaceae bacterium]
MVPIGNLSRAGSLELVVRVVLAVAARPTLWPTATVMALRLAAPRWWRRAPFVPLPPTDYLRFRLVTNYGPRAPSPRRVAADVLTYLRWCADAGGA